MESMKMSMNIYNIGDKVRVKSNANQSVGARICQGKIGTILEINQHFNRMFPASDCKGYVVLDIEGPRPGGIWMDEIEPAFLLETEYEYI